MQVSARAATTPADISQSYVLDLNAVESLKTSAKHDPKNAIKQVASQFEAMFLNTLMKTMRQTSFDGEEDSNALDTYQGMFDQQLVQQLAGSGRGTGLAAALEKQLAKAAGVDMGEDAARTGINGQARDMSSMVQTMPPPSWGKQVGTQRSTLETALAKLSEPRVKMEAPAVSNASSAPATGGPAEFTKTLLPHAQQAAQELGVAPHLVVAHAALESGWGKKPIRHADGSDSHNLFSIKAGGSWKGKTVDILTTEYVDGAPQKRVERFRAYDNYQDAFADYARLIKNNPRYQGALNQGTDAAGFARGLARGGYATDPNYAAKLSQLAGKSSS